MRRRSLLLGLWLGGTLTAMVLASLAVQLASAKVTDRPTAIVSRRQVQTELDEPTTSTLPPSTVAPTTAAPPPGPAPEVAVPAAPTAPASPPSTVRPAVSSIPGPPTVDPAPAPTSSTTSTTRPSTTTSTTRWFPDGDGHDGRGPGDGDHHRGDGFPSPNPEPTPTSTPTSTPTYLLEGGWVRVRCAGDAIALVSASPNPGYRMDIRDDGPQRVDVRFASGWHESDLAATCQDGIARPVTDESGR